MRFVEERLTDDGSRALPSFEEYAEWHCDAMRDFDRLALLYAALQDRLHLDPDGQL